MNEKKWNDSLYADIFFQYITCLTHTADFCVFKKQGLPNSFFRFISKLHGLANMSGLFKILINGSIYYRKLFRKGFLLLMLVTTASEDMHKHKRKREIWRRKHCRTVFPPFLGIFRELHTKVRKKYYFWNMSNRVWK